MIRLGLRLAFTGGWGRPLLLASCTAVVSGLLLVTVALLRLRGEPDEMLWSVAADPGTRGGMAFAVVMLGLPPLLLLYQAVRLGTAARERRLASLRLAGATPGEVRGIGAVEVGAPALIGSILGIGFYLLLRALLGAPTFEGSWAGGDRVLVRAPLAGPGLLPTQTTPLWWQYVAVVLGVTVLGVLVGITAGRGVIVTPLGVLRRAPKGAPRPWGLLLILAGVAAGFVLVRFFGQIDSQLVGVASVALILLGAVSLSSWTAALVGRRVAARASRAHVLLAARRLASDPRSSARAGAAVGGIGVVAGGAAVFLADVLQNGRENDYVDAEQVHAVLLVLGLLLAALVVVVGSLSVHAVESVLDGKRSVAALAALGTPREVLARALRWEAGMVTLPTAVGGVLVGSALYGVAASAGGGGLDGLWPLLTLAVLVATVGLVLLAILASTWLTRPWLRRAAAPGNLRTE